MNADGTFDYDPNGQFESLAVGETGTDTFSYTIDDGVSTAIDRHGHHHHRRCERPTGGCR